MGVSVESIRNGLTAGFDEGEGAVATGGLEHATKRAQAVTPLSGRRGFIGIGGEMDTSGNAGWREIAGQSYAIQPCGRA